MLMVHKHNLTASLIAPLKTAASPARKRYIQGREINNLSNAYLFRISGPDDDASAMYGKLMHRVFPKTLLMTYFEYRKITGECPED